MTIVRTLASLLVVASVITISACGNEVPSQTPGAVGSGTVQPSRRVIPSVCDADEDCAQGFHLDGRLYFFSCRHVRPGAVDDYQYAAGAGEFEEVRRIPGLPPELFLAVRGRIACTPGGSDWWLAQTASAVSELDPPLRDRLSDATEP